MLDAAAPQPAESLPSSATANPVVAWLLDAGWQIADPGDFTAAFANHLTGLGLPLSRVRITLRILHPQLIGTTFTWQRGAEGFEVYDAPYSLLQSDDYLSSPYAGIFQGAGAIRRRLDIADAVLDYPILKDLQAAGATDYVAMPVHFSDGRINAITFATDRPGGMSTAELEMLYGMLPALGRIMEVHALRRTARSILDTYLGRQSGERVLNGLVKRGDGEDIHAIIWFCDLRESTQLAESLPRTEFLELLNAFFECTAGAVLDQGGEVLRFIGDAVLAIFPIAGTTDQPELCPEHEAACQKALGAAREAMARVEDLNRRRDDAGRAPIGFGIGLHLGEVTYGNIGVPERLEFSVIGAAANEAARIEGLCKDVGKRLLISADLARVLPENWVSIGRHRLRGVGTEREIFTLADVPPDSATRTTT